MSSRTLTDFNASPCRDDVETGGGEVVAEVWDVVEAHTKAGGAEMELGLVVGADQPQLAFNNLKTSLFAEALELFGGHFGALDAQQFCDPGGIFLEYS